ncbi:glycosyltransferase [Protaetiibacter larvae]|uniref:Glycosyltransferase n=1 Tax=Protaetiibacter larvae TaxID=2592654 RepID=A0A5C1Y852_9MICO|nr:nucleotide disphospho-sugar-binding domain-containing protein [Protaetiibacter larvae]QEO09926.1 glycosyltransferase [Protaetiibacter larvae]
MSEVLMIGGDVGGNVPPALAIADELARRGHRVTLAGVRARPGDPQPTGVVEVPLQSFDDVDITRATGTVGQLRALSRLGMSAAVTREVRALIAEGRPDAVILDGIMLRALKHALRSGVPTVVLFHSLGAFWADGATRGPVDVLMRPFGMRPATLWGAAAARILPTDRQLDPAGSRSDVPAFDWVGTTEPGAPPASRTPGAPPLVLVSLSSAWQSGQLEVYRRIVAALGGLPVRAIVTTGGVDLEGELAPLPNVEVRGRVPHAELLPHVDLVVGHGGHSTTLKTLAHGIPLLVLPMNPASDQRLIGGVVETAGLGRVLPRTAPVERIRDTVRELLADDAVRAAAARTGERLRAQRGAAVAADLLEQRVLAGR